MTAVDDRPVASIADLFENLDVPEGLKAELLRGEIVMMAGPDWVHNMIVQSVQDQIPRARWDRLQTQDIAIPGESSEPQPDLVVHEHGAFEGPGRLIPAPAITMVMEVVSKTSADRDYRLKPSMYAAGQVDAYLIVDPFAARCVLLTEPTGSGEAARYQVERTAKFGDPLPVDVLVLTLDTSQFRTLPRD
ncbi:Uma2 family endonuclease [Streptomyces sp. NPDC006208]|uniref:Uma2 family endonuclease n=1 Tax=Streptomyces sp. NPDC006208 TaxID=3156734 RepID=UPI0033BAEEB1